MILSFWGTEIALEHQVPKARVFHTTYFLSTIRLRVVAPGAPFSPADFLFPLQSGTPNATFGYCSKGGKSKSLSTSS